MNEPVKVRPASTVVLLRDAADAPELLMVRRNRALAFAGGFWVFPGGAVDDLDRQRAGDDEELAARFAAAREAEEEAGVAPDPAAMALVSHWTTPIPERKRFSTWIYAAQVPADTPVTIDGSEIHDFQWCSARAALEAHRAGDLPMMPPTYITLCALARYASAGEAVCGERETPCPRVLPTMVQREAAEGGFLTLYPGDVGYEGGDVEAQGPRHRTVLVDGSWQYEYDCNCDSLPLYPIS